MTAKAPAIKKRASGSAGKNRKTGQGKPLVKKAPVGKTGVSKFAKPLRIREELLPDSARYLTLDNVEYVMIPVAEFGDWYEDAIDSALVHEYGYDDEPAIPWEDVKKELFGSGAK